MPALPQMARRIAGMLFMMGVAGPGRILGSLLAGHIAAHSLSAVFAFATGLCLAALLLFTFAFFDRSGPDAPAPP